MFLLITSAALVVAFPCIPQEDADMPVRQILTLTGASCIEELDESELERFARLEAAPVHLNSAGMSGLLSCGLFTRFQAASIVDYRKRSGDIMSIPELSLLDGFNPEYAGALEPFVSLDSKIPPGKSRPMHRTSGSALVRTALKAAERDVEEMYGTKITFDISDILSLKASVRAPYSVCPDLPRQFTGSATYYGKGHIGKIVLGDFNARFAQGLLLWSGYTMSGLPTSAAFSRRASGISPSGSYTSAMRGIAADAVFGHFTFSAAVSENALPAFNSTLTLDRSSFGVTLINGRDGKLMAGTDGTCTAGRFHLFYEAAYDVKARSAAFVGGCEYIWSYDGRASLLLRNYPSSFVASSGGPPRSGSKATDELGAAFGLRSGKWDMTFDAMRKAEKAVSRYRLVLTGKFPLADSASAALRLSASYKPQESPSAKAGLRMDAEWNPGLLMLHLRTEIQYCESLSELAYIEAGYRWPHVSFFFRATPFHAPSWNDRIYVYERDAPGNFNVPAYYGKGASVSLFMNAKWKMHKLYLGLSSVFYAEDRAGKCEARLQYVFTWQGRRRDK